MSCLQMLTGGPLKEAEVKLRLPDPAAHQRLSNELAPRHLRTHLQDNLFFDGAAGELSSRFAVLFIRFYDDDTSCFLCLKVRARLASGVSLVEGESEDIEPTLGRALAAEPWRLADLASTSNIMKKVVDELGMRGDGGKVGSFVCLGGFKNIRAVYGWEEGHVLELDETQFEFGTNYEVECETADPERAKEILEKFLKDIKVPYEYSQASKFAMFRAGKLLHAMSP